MKPSQALLLVVALALAAGLLWFLDDSEAVEETPLTSAPASAEEPAGDGGVLTDPGRLSTPEGGASEVTVDEREELAAATDSAVTEEVEAKVTGRVLDGFGSPIAGARIFAARGSDGFPMQIDELGEDSPPWLEVQRAESDATGTFELPAESWDTWRIAVRAKGFAPLRLERPAPALPELTLGELVLESSAILEGHVVDSRGRGVHEARISVLPPRLGGMVVSFTDSSRKGLTSSGPSGEFRVDELAAGPYRLQVHHPDHPDAIYEGSTSEPGERQSGLLIELEDGHRITGRVVGIESGREGGFRVRADDRSPGELGDVHIAFGMGRRAEVEADGTFVLRGLRKAEHALTVIEVGEDEFWGSERSEEVLAEAGEQGVLLRLRAGASIAFQVLDAVAGAPLEEFQVSAGYHWLESLKDEDGDKRERFPEGRVSIDEIEIEDGRDYSIRVARDGYRTVELEGLRPEAGKVLELAPVILDRVPLVSLHVVDAASGKPVRGARVRMRPERGTDDPYDSIFADFGDDSLSTVFGGSTEVQKGRTDKEGRVQLSSFPGETVVFSATHKNFADYESEPVPLPAAEGFELRLRLFAGGKVTVHVLDPGGEPAKGVAVEHQAADESREIEFNPFANRSRSSNSKGHVVFGHLPAGVHRFRLSEDGGGHGVFGSSTSIVIGEAAAGAADSAAEGWTEVSVSEGSEDEITLRAPRRGSLRGKITEAGRPLAGAQVSLERPGKGEASLIRMAGFGGGSGVKTSGDGSFLIEDVKLGEWMLVVEHPDRAMPASIELELLEESTEREFDLDVTIIEGRVTDERGEPVAGARVGVQAADGSEVRGGNMRVASVMMVGDSGSSISFSSGHGPDATSMTAADGTYRLRGVRSGMKLIVTVDPDSSDLQGDRSEPLEVTPGEVRGDVDFELVRAGAISVVILDAAGVPASFCTVEASFDEEVEDEVEDVSEFVFEGGKTTLDGLRPGRWLVQVQPVREEDGAPTPEPQAVEVEVGETAELEFRLP